MNASMSLPVTGYEILFRSLFEGRRSLAFPCDARGQVLLDALDERARNNYLYARAVVGGQFASSAVVDLSAVAAQTASE